MKRLTLFACTALAALAIAGCKKAKKEEKTETPPAEAPAEAPTAEKPTEPPPAETPPPAEPAAPEKPASVTDDQVKSADDYVAAIDAAATAAEGAAGDCKKMGKALGAEAGKMKPMAKKMDAMRTAMAKDQAAMDWFKATYEPKVTDAYGKLTTAAEPCKSDKAVASALKTFAPPAEKAPAGGDMKGGDMKGGDMKGGDKGATPPANK
jgi:hypothetical protein